MRIRIETLPALRYEGFDLSSCQVGQTYEVERRLAMYQAVAAGDVDVISAFSTDGRIEAFDLKILEDDRGAIPPYDAVILAGPRLVRDRPDVIAVLRQLAGTIDADRMRRMNFAVDENGADPATVAEAFRRDLRTTKGNQGIPQ